MPLPISSARIFFDHINSQSDPFAYLSSVADPSGPQALFFEEEWLDFKGAPASDKDERKIWSKGLSGFANITDGVIVWGIDARKTQPRNIDAACGLRLIADPQAFESRLRDWIRDATNAPVTGVEYKSFPGPNGEGFVVCLIPESSYKPHRAEWADKQYYYRAGDDFLPAEPGLLRTLFFPQRSGHVDITSTLNYAITYSEMYGQPPHIEVEFPTLLSIGGSSTGRDIYITFLGKPWVEMQIGTGQYWHYFGYETRPAFLAMRPLHPGEKVVLFCGRSVKLRPGAVAENGQWVLKWDAMEFEFEVYVADQERRVTRLLFEAGTSIPGVREGIITAQVIS
jgi:hypothetical protein